MVLRVNSQASIFPLQLKKQSLLLESVVVKSMASGYVGARDIAFVCFSILV